MAKWIQETKLKRGALHRQLGVPVGEPIPLELLWWATRQPGVLGRRARLAMTLRGLSKPKHRKAAARHRR